MIESNRADRRTTSNEVPTKKQEGVSIGIIFVALPSLNGLSRKEVVALDVLDIVHSTQYHQLSLHICLHLSAFLLALSILRLCACIHPRNLHSFSTLKIDKITRQQSCHFVGNLDLRLSIEVRNCAPASVDSRRRLELCFR